MIVKTPDDLFRIHSLEQDIQIKIRQFYNADNGSIFEINSLLSRIKRGDEKARKRYNIFVSKQGKFLAVYKKVDNVSLIEDIKIVPSTQLP